MLAFNSIDLPTLAAICLCISAFLLYVAYPDRLVATNPREDLPGPKGVPLFGNLFQALAWRGRMLQWLKHLQDRYGPLCTFTFPPWGRGILINRPEWLLHVKQGDNQIYSRGLVAIEIFTEFPGGRTTVATEGAEWCLARKAIFPLFTSKSFTIHVSLAMNEIIPVARSLLLSASKKGVPVDWNELTGRIATAIFMRSSLDICITVLDGDVSCLENPDALSDALKILNETSSRRLFNPFWRITELFTGENVRFRQSRSYVRTLVETIVHSRRADLTCGKTDVVHTDFLSGLLENPAYDDPIVIRDTLVAMLFGGRENTQNALSWALHALMGAPEWMRRLREEAASMRQRSTEMQYNDLATYHVHLAVFYETVRLWPGLPKNARLALCDDVLPAVPERNLPAVKVEKGDYVFWSDYHMMRSEDIWGPTAGDFDPGRHLNEEGHFVKPTLPDFVGFGAGPRLWQVKHPAAPLVTYEFVACLAGILPYFDFAPSMRTTADGKEYQKPKLAEAYTAPLEGPLVVDVHVLEGVDLPVAGCEGRPSTAMFCTADGMFHA
ncbi:cytochrome P450 [Lentinus tigrinus ALCF2SS1-7]|uniref:Cytochrome P450 n=1 Tax=Lentinus tigrinus ALCF2SS1-6 TaxID=1328759 RepID=A0A5C2S9V8_9APHY|nr:cytochrome P450 [Lentinus tigrinus ALCF2SS1-6]RPD75855.1 cytochrome P450 [Lentinus tigrinus ALCF2SS1-7]